jgi:1,4-alpha-glucan branching enzyme
MRRVGGQSKWKVVQELKRWSVAAIENSPLQPFNALTKTMKPFAVSGLPPDELNSFLSGTHSDPFRILGPHRTGDDLVIRVFRPDAQKIDILLAAAPKAFGGGGQDRQPPIAAEKVHRDGFFCASVPGASRDLDYRIQVTTWDGSKESVRDPYQYGPIMG